MNAIYEVIRRQTDVTLNLIVQKYDRESWYSEYTGYIIIYVVLT